MRSVGIVCGYDLNDGLPDYVKSVAPLIERENLDFVILSGGRTSPRSHHSEAWVMAEHLRRFAAHFCRHTRAVPDGPESRLQVRDRE